MVLLKVGDAVGNNDNVTDGSQMKTEQIGHKIFVLLRSGKKALLRLLQSEDKPRQKACLLTEFVV